MNKIVRRISKMHKHFRMSGKHLPFEGQSEKNFRVRCMLEEVQEYVDSKTKEDELDAMVDLIIFALGTLERQDMLDKFECAFNMVMDSNIKKVLGKNKKRGGFRIDLVKPPGWKKPNLSILFKGEGK